LGGGVSDLSDLEKEIDKLFEGAVTQEQRNEVWATMLECIHEILDDEEWANFKKHFFEGLAKKFAH
jgi:hypothetical protein